MECYPRAAFILLREFSYAAAELREPLRLSRSCVDSRQLQHGFSASEDADTISNSGNRYRRRSRIL